MIEQVDNYGALIELQRLTQDRLRQMLKTRTLRGFPINMPFTDEDEIVAKVGMVVSRPMMMMMDTVVCSPIYMCCCCCCR